MHVVVAASEMGVEGEVKSIGFINSKPIRQGPSSNSGTITVATAAPPPPYGFTLLAGQKKELDVPIHGVAAGPVNIIAQTFGFTPVFEDRNAQQTIMITVSNDPPPTPPTEVCGFDVFTYVAAVATGSTLAVESADTIGVGTKLLIDPCAPNAEQVTVSAVDGDTLTVAPAMM